MKKLLILLVTLSLFAVPVIAQETKTEPAAEEATKQEVKYDFRKIRWGMTVEEVLESEDGFKRYPMDQYLENLYKDVIVYGMKARLSYEIMFGKVCSSFYQLLEKYNDGDKYIDDFNRIQKLLEDEYGEPDNKPSYKWKNELYSSNPDSHGVALMMGILTIDSNWFYENSGIRLKVSHELFSYKENIVHGVYFAAKDIIEIRYRHEVLTKKIPNTN